MLAVARDERLHRGGERQGQQCSDHTEQGRTDEHGAVSHGDVDLHGLGGDLRGEEIVLDLLIGEDHEEDEEAGPGCVNQGDQDRQGAGDVRAHHGDELAHDANPEGEGHRERHVQHFEGDPVSNRRQHRQDAPGEDVATGLLDGEIPDAQHGALAGRRKERTDRAAQLRSFGHDVEREEQDREGLEQHVDDGGAEIHDVVGEAVGQIGGATAVDELLGNAREVDVFVDVVAQP